MPEDGYHGKDIIDIATKIKEIDGDKYLEMDEGKAIAFFRNKGTEYELQKIKDILNEFRVMFGFLKHHYMKMIGSYQQLKN